MTLADLNFTYDTTGLDDLKTTINNSLTLSNSIEETPSILTSDLDDIVDYFSNNFETNLENFASDIKDYFDQQTINLKNEIENNLALDSSTIYDIHVQNAVHADNSDKFDGKTFNEVISYIVTNYISNATVANSLKFDGKTYNQVKSDIQTNVKVDNAANADKFNNMDYTTVKNDIISSISTSDGASLDVVQDKVENEWIAFKANDSIMFDGNDSDTWKTSIIPGIKVNNAVNADKLNNYSYNDLITSINTMIENQLSNFTSENTFINAVKEVKVDNATNADNANNALKFNNKTYTDMKNDIKTNLVVDEASNATSFANKTESDWKTYIQNEISGLQTDLTSGNVIPAKAVEVEKINGIDVSDFDDHIKNIADQEYTELTGDINAKYLNGYDFDNLMTYIQGNVKVDNATNADNATYATNASSSDNANTLSNKTYSTIEEEARDLTVQYLQTNPLNIIDIDISTEDNFNINSSLLNIYEYFHPTNYFVIPDISKFLYGFARQTFSYNDNGNISEIKYFSSSDLLTFNDGTKITDDQYVIQHEIYSYDDNENISSIQKDFYLLISIIDDKPYTKVTFKQTITYDSNGNITEINNEAPVGVGIDSDSLLTS